MDRSNQSKSQQAASKHHAKHHRASQAAAILQPKPTAAAEQQAIKRQRTGPLAGLHIYLHRCTSCCLTTQLLSQGIAEFADVIASLKLDLLLVPIASSAHDRDWGWQIVWLRNGLMICHCISGSATLIQQTCAFDQHICISLVCAAPCTNP